MDPEILQLTVDEALRFVNFAERLQAAQQERGDSVLFGSKESGAVRRASLDLTRALAELRNRRVIDSP
jgi:hypothetical protein